MRGVASLMSGISSESREQAGGIEQVHRDLDAMQRTTGRNAALVAEASDAAQAMQAQASVLAEAVAVFRLAPPARAAALVD